MQLENLASDHCSLKYLPASLAFPTTYLAILGLLLFSFAAPRPCRVTLLARGSEVTPPN